MPKRIPIAAAKRVAKEQDLRQVILLAWDGELTHVVTYGTTGEDCVQAALGGNKVKRALGWPESMCNATPARGRGVDKNGPAVTIEGYKALRREGEQKYLAEINAAGGKPNLDASIDYSIAYTLRKLGRFEESV